MTETNLVQPQGRLDAFGARNAWTELEPLTREPSNHILVDMSETRYISSDGLRLLMRATKTVKNNGGKLVICCLNARLTEIVTMAGLEHVLEIYPTRTLAEHALDAHTTALD